MRWGGAGKSVLVTGAGTLLGVALLLSAPGATASPPVTNNTAAEVLFTSPLGQGTACTSGAPCSLLGAQAAARVLSPTMHTGIDVMLDGGTYDLTQPLTFGPQDSGMNGYQVTYTAAPGAHPIISGGYTILGWHQVDQAHNIWAAPVSDTFDTEQLYVNGQSVPRSQGLPKAGYLQNRNGFITTSPVLAGWPDITNVAAVFTGGNGAWTQPSCNIASVRGDVITMSQPCWGNLHLPGDGSQELSWVDGPQGGFGGLSGAAMPSFFENAYELLAPGHWSLDRTSHQIFYEPAAGQNMATASMLAPVLQNLVTVQGTLDNPVHDITFRGLQFSYGTWDQPDTNDGFAEMQADWTLTGPGAAESEGTCGDSSPHGTCPFASWTRLPANVVLSATHDVTMADDTFSHLGGAGLDVENGSQHDLIQGNEFTDIAASAIQLGSTDDPLPAYVGADDREINTYDTITDNDINNVANQFLGGVGIWEGYAQHAMISHNQIDDVPYTGISIGWAGWHSSFIDPNSDPNINADNLISDNLIFNYMQTLGDGGAIYTNGGQADGWAQQLVITGNVAYNAPNTDFSLYTDTGSKYVDLTDNVVYDQPIDSFSTGGCHTVGHIRVSGNYFAQVGPLYPCDAVGDIEATNNTLICNTLPPSQAPTGLLAQAGLEPAYRALLLAQAPTVASVGPAILPLSGGPVLIGGSGFDATAAVHFGVASASSVTVLSSNYLLATAPPGTGGVQISVTTAAGTSAPSKISQVSYQANPLRCLRLVSGSIGPSLLP